MKWIYSRSRLLYLRAASFSFNLNVQVIRVRCAGLYGRFQILSTEESKIKINKNPKIIKIHLEARLTNGDIENIL